MAQRFNTGPKTLESVRRLLTSLGKDPGTAVARDIVAVAGALEHGSRLTIDDTVTAALGTPLVVLRVPDTPVQSILDKLTSREREVALLLAEGLRNREIASRLTISPATVKDHVHSILSKTGCRSRTAFTASLRRG